MRSGDQYTDHNELRQKYADMVAAEGGIYVVFNSTVYPSTYHEIPDVVNWGLANMDKVKGQWHQSPILCFEEFLQEVLLRLY